MNLLDPIISVQASGLTALPEKPLDKLLVVTFFLLSYFYQVDFINEMKRYFKYTKKNMF